jgi:hypothetical protein
VPYKFADQDVDLGSKTITAANILSGATQNFEGNTITGTLIVPSANDVRSGVSVASTTGNLTLPSDTIRGTGASGELHIGSTVGTVSTTNTILRFDGTTGMVFDDDRGPTFRQIILGPAAIVTSSGSTGSHFINSTGPSLVMMDNSSLTANQAMTIYSLASGGDIITSGSGAGFNGTANITMLFADDGNIPAFNYTGSGNFYVRENTAVNTPTITQTGDLSFSGGLNIFRQDETGLTSYDQNGNTIAAASLNFGSNHATGSFSGDFTFTPSIEDALLQPKNWMFWVVALSMLKY